MDIKLEEKVTSSLVDGQLPCVVAFKIAKELKASPREVGETADELGLRIVQCQLGCFAVEKATRPGLDDMEIPTALAEGLQAAMINRQLSCSTAFEVGKNFEVSRKQVGDAATKLNIRLIDCQLGCFP